LNQKALFGRIYSREDNMKKFIAVFLLPLAIAACSSSKDAPYNQADFAQGGPDAPVMNERTSTFMQADNPFANVDSFKPKTPQEKEQNDNKWNTSRVETRWQEYRGTMVRVEILLGDTDLREMRLRLMQNADGMDIDSDIRGVLARVADHEMKRVCGRNTESIVMVYDKPSFAVMRPTPYFDFRIDSEGAAMREYGFRCVYNN